jgi:NAD/NADP transhydrogenase beta subunit
MPILNADKAKNVIVIKRGQGQGFSGIDNALFVLDQHRACCTATRRLRRPSAKH